MYRIGLFYYLGLRGLGRDPAKALTWFSKAVEKGEPRSMEMLGEIYTIGAGVVKNYTKAIEWLLLASEQQLFSAYNGMGYLYVKGYGVERNYTKAKEYFEKAAAKGETGAYYNLGVMYLKGIGVKREVGMALSCFVTASFHQHPKALYQLAKMFHMGVALKKSLSMAIEVHKLIAKHGPWSILSRWALESYIKGDVGTSFFLYSIMCELGNEVAQSNTAWILEKYGEYSMCMGESGLCTNAERHQRAHSLWWQVSENGNAASPESSLWPGGSEKGDVTATAIFILTSGTTIGLQKNQNCSCSCSDGYSSLERLAQLDYTSHLIVYSIYHGGIVITEQQ